MAKPKNSESKPEEVEVVFMRKVAPERFDVVAGVVRGSLEVTKVLEKSVSLMVARGTARLAIDKQTERVKASLGMEAKS